MESLLWLVCLFLLVVTVSATWNWWKHRQTVNRFRSIESPTDEDRMAYIRQVAQNPDHFREWCRLYAQEVSAPGFRVNSIDISDTLAPYLIQTATPGELDRWTQDLRHRVTERELLGIPAEDELSRILNAPPTRPTSNASAPTGNPTDPLWKAEFDRHWENPHTNEAFLWWSRQIDKNSSMIDTHLAALKFYALKTGQPLLSVLPDPNSYKGHHWWKQQIAEDPEAEIVMKKVIDYHRDKDIQKH